jgi:hypothetical protein
MSANALHQAHGTHGIHFAPAGEQCRLGFGIFYKKRFERLDMFFVHGFEN